MPLILHIDTSGPTGLVMLAHDGRTLVTRYSGDERDHAGKLNGLVADALAESRLSLRNIDAVAVCNGPGSYTGLRIGLATAKGYCYALNKPLILHNRLLLMLRETDAAMQAEPVNTLAVLPARTGEYYAAAQGLALAFLPRHILAIELQLLLQDIKEPLQIIGQAEADLSPLVLIKQQPYANIDPATWAAVAMADFAAERFADTAYAVPDYLKPVFITARRADKNIPPKVSNT